MNDVRALHLKRRIAVLTDGRVVPITQLFDSLGDETDDVSRAVSFVAGEGRFWFSAPIANYAAVIVQ